MQYLIEPQGWPCKLKDCPPGYFIFFGRLALKLAPNKSPNDSLVAYNDGGQVFQGNLHHSERPNILVQSVTVRVILNED